MDREKFFNGLFEHVLTQMGYLSLSLSSRGERIYHALFETAFHGDTFLSLITTTTGTEMVLGRGSIPWEWRREAWNTWNSFGELPPLPPESTTWVQLLAIEDVPGTALADFERQMEQLRPFDLEDAQCDTETRDGMKARGVIIDEQHIHRFDIRTGYSLTDSQVQFFQAIVELGYACFAKPEQDSLHTIQRYFSHL